MENLKKKLIKYFKTLGIEVYTNTKARGHQGFYIKNRIDISKSTREERIVPTLLHEFAHFIHDKLEGNVAKTGGSLEILFDCKNIVEIEKELLLVTNFVDENSLLHKLKIHKEQVKKKIKVLENEIRVDYPNFMRSKKFKEFDKYIKKSKAKYLLKYDRVKFISPFLRREEIFSIDNIERDFSDMPKAFVACLRLKSNQRKQARISRKINHYEKYYSKPTELFARFVEGLYLDYEKTHKVAPQAFERFFELLDKRYYFELKEALQLSSGLNIETTNLSPKYLLAQS